MANPKQTGSDNPAWKGGRYTRGYVYVRVPRGHHLARSNGYAPEHRLVAEQMLGRQLAPAEVVHHRNHDKTDNRPENLEVLASQMHHVRDGHGGHLRHRSTTECWCGDREVARGLCDRHYKMAARYWKSIGRTMDSFQY